MDTLVEMKLVGRKVEKKFNNACWEEAITKVKKKLDWNPLQAMLRINTKIGGHNIEK